MIALSDIFSHKWFLSCAASEAESGFILRDTFILLSILMLKLFEDFWLFCNLMFVEIYQMWPLKTEIKTRIDKNG